MNKEIFLRDLRRFLEDIPEEEREQALTYYEDYFEDAGPENEQKVIQELGSPIDIARQIKATNQEHIAYGQGNDFHRNHAYPNTYDNSDSTNKDTQNSQNTANSHQDTWSQNEYAKGTNTQNGYTGNFYSQNYNSNHDYQNQKKSWTQDSTKVALVIVLAILALPVGLPLLSAAFGLLVALIAVVFSLILVFFALGGALVIAGIASLIGSFFTIGGIANTLVAIGSGFILTSIGIFIFWFGIFFCAKFFPAIFRGIGKCFQSIGNGIRSFFN